MEGAKQGRVGISAANIDDDLRTRRRESESGSTCSMPEPRQFGEPAPAMEEGLGIATPIM
jgi:hypothetical protein